MNMKYFFNYRALQISIFFCCPLYVSFVFKVLPREKTVGTPDSLELLQEQLITILILMSLDNYCSSVH